jgi:methylmalonyl-CoA/ethylmalonyl-CoA epimerase
MTANKQSLAENESNGENPLNGASKINYRAIDHIALAVQDLNAAITLFTDVLGLKLVRRVHVKAPKPACTPPRWKTVT